MQYRKGLRCAVCGMRGHAALEASTECVLELRKMLENGVRLVEMERTGVMTKGLDVRWAVGVWVAKAKQALEG